jgi:uncharacterized protein (TIGR03032 family)
MRRVSQEQLEGLWSRSGEEWRDPAQIASQWPGASDVDPRLLRHAVRGDWWEILASTGMTLLVTREYEHLLMAMRAGGKSRPDISYLPLPHPSGLAINDRRRVVHVASTRNPNQVFDLMPVVAPRNGPDAKTARDRGRRLVPVRSRFLPGGLYLHDMAMIGGKLYANAVGENSVVRLHDDGHHERVWWPRSVETNAGAFFEQNYLQLNSIAAGATIKASYFSASADKPSARRPGQKNFPVDGRGVIFSGATREPVVRGLTRPHSARLHQKRLWVNNSGYGEFCVVDGSGFEAIARLPGWTRGLSFHQGVAFVGTSRVLPRFRQYAPGLDMEKSSCGLHAVEVKSGRVLGSLTWPFGNQIFAVELISDRFATGLPFTAGARRSLERDRRLFYSFRTFS